MKQLTRRSRHRLLAYLVLTLLAACQGRGRVHEVPPASYPEDAPAAVPEGQLDAPETAPIEREEDGPSRDYAEPPGTPAAAAPADGSARSGQSAPKASQRPAREAEEQSSAALGSGDGRDANSDSFNGERALEPRDSLVPRQRQRPGLATHWGETRFSPARQVDFERWHDTRPSATLELHYDDRSGARRMLPNGRWGRAEANAPSGLSVRVVDATGHTLPALTDGSRVIAVGVPGERYALTIENPSSRRFEVVASVDGLDVLDGEDASFEKRGYLIGAYSSVTIDGFRRSDAEVAAFRLGDVARSYAASKGKARNVGVIGLACFEERRPVVFEPPVWRRSDRDDDTERRRQADPFPGRYARPPVW
jgi:hypothetical protein